MTCLLDNTYLHFKNSDIKVRPISLTSRQNETQDDWFKAKFAKQAIQYISENAIDREPVEWYISGNSTWRGYIEHESIKIGKTEGFVELNDCLEILEYGAIDKEFYDSTLDKVVDYAWDQVVDPEGVLLGIDKTIQSGKVVYQHNKNPLGRMDITQGMYDWLHETLDILPLYEGDGPLDFRGDTPREVFAEICRLWNVTMYVRPDGNFVIGFPDMEPNIYTAGTDKGTWKLVDYQMPQPKKPVGTIYVQGSTPSVWEGPIQNAGTRFIKRLDNVTPWAAATIGSYEKQATTIEYNRSSDPKALESVAVRYLANQYQKAHTGTLTVDIFASPGGPSTVAALKIGDVISVGADPQCGVPGGAFRINGIQHDWGPQTGWLIHFNVVGLVPNDIQTKSWWYDPLNPEMNTYDPSLYLKITAPIMDVSNLLVQGISKFVHKTTSIATQAGETFNMLPYSQEQVVDTVVDTTESVIDDVTETVNEYIDI
jgi:hypothetical protein